MISIKEEIKGKLLAWYDNNQRILPWRAQSNQIPNPYYVYLSEIMLQQTTVATVKAYFERFIKKWPTLEHLANASLDEILVEWQGLGYYSRARNLHRTIKLLASMAAFPKSPEDLRLLPGIGDYTAAAVASIAFNYPVIPVDGNIMRVFSRVFTIPFAPPALKDEVINIANDIASEHRSGDFAQALMDLGALICRPKDPKCQECPLNSLCAAFQEQRVNEFPFPKLKRNKSTRYGTAFILLDKGSIFLEKRPEKGLLGGMMGVPTTPWEEIQPQQIELFAPEDEVEWQTLSEPVKHTFTHFHLNLTVKIGKSKRYPQGIWVKLDQLNSSAIPTVMKKVIKRIPEGFYNI